MGIPRAVDLSNLRKFLAANLRVCKFSCAGDGFERNEFSMLKDVLADIAPAVFAALVLSMVGVAGAVQIAIIFG